MKKMIIYLMLFMVSITSIYAQDVKRVDLKQFQKIYVQEGIDVMLTKGEKNHATVYSNQIDKVRLVVKNNTLVIDIDNPWNKMVNHKTRVELIAEQVYTFKVSSGATIDMKSTFTNNTHKIVASSGGEIYYKGNCSELSIEGSSGSDIEGDVSANKIFIDASSSTDIDLTGQANYVMIDASSSADVSLLNLSADKINVDASSSADVTVSVKNQLNADASSSADIRYRIIEQGKKNLNINKNTSSSGSIKQIK